MGWTLVCLGMVVSGWAVEIGMARVNVLQELGQPAAALARGDTEVMTYRDGTRITLKDGRVTEIKGWKPPEATPAPVVPSPEAQVPADSIEAALHRAEVEEREREANKLAAAQAKSQAELEKSLTELEQLHSQPPPVARAPDFHALDFVIGLLLKWALTLAALKLTCKYWGCEVSWRGLMTVAAVDVGVRGVIGLIGFLLLRMSSLFYADEAVAALVMVLVLRKVSYNQSLAQAVQITLTTKVFSVVVGSFLFVVLMHQLR